MSTSISSDTRPHHIWSNALVCSFPTTEPIDTHPVLMQFSGLPTVAHTRPLQT